MNRHTSPTTTSVFHTIRLTLLLGVLMLLGGQGRAQVFSDNFNDAVLDTNKWEVQRPFCDSDVFLSSGNAVLLNRGLLQKVGEAPTSLVLRTRFKFTGSPHDQFRIVWRSDGDTSNVLNASREFIHCVRLSAQLPNSEIGPVGFILLDWTDHPTAHGIIALVQTNLQANTFYDVRIEDDGSEIKVFWGTNTIPLITGNRTNRYGSRLAFHNREGACGGSSISAGSRVELDYVSVEQLSPNLAHGLVAYYPFNGNADNAAGPGYNGSVVGAQPTADRFGNPASAYAFNGLGDYITAPALPDSQEFTVSAWIRPVEDKYAGIFYDAAYSTPGRDTILELLPGSKLRATFTKIGSPGPYPLESDAIVITGAWQHVVLSLRTNGSALYFNGVPVATTNQAGNNIGYHSPIYLGAENHGLGPEYFFHGDIDDVRIYARGLTDAEVQQLYVEERRYCVPRRATAVAQVVNGFVVGATITDGGCGYVEAPAVLIAGGGGIGALATAVVSNGVVVAINILNAGFGYTTPPAIVIDLPPMPPVLVQGPTPQIVLAGTTATLQAGAEGSLPLRYQWLKDGQALAGASESVLALTNCRVADSGFYAVVVTNLYGAVTSAPARLWVTTNTFDLGMVAYYPFDGNARDASGSGNDATPAGTFQYLTYGLSGGALRIFGDRSDYYSGGGHVLLPTFGEYLNSGYTFSLWVKDEVVAGWPAEKEAYVAFGDDSAKGVTIWLAPQVIAFEFDDNPTTVVDINLPVSDLGWTWQTYPLVWKHLVLTCRPGLMSGYVNGDKVVEVDRAFDIFPVGTAALGRHWWGNGSFSSARMSVTYDNVRIYNRALSDDEVAELFSSEGPATPPLITSQPRSRTNVVSSSVMFSVTASGTLPFNYQWRKGGVNLAGATDRTLVIANVQPGDAGAYSVVVTDTYGGMATSSVAELTVRSLVPPAVMTGPVANPANGHLYYLLSPSTWVEAEAAAVALGGHLATVRSEAENAWLYATFGASSNHLWIGLYDPDPFINATNAEARRAEFGWVSGESSSYMKWHSAEPNNWDEVGEFYGNIMSPAWGAAGGYWNDTWDTDFNTTSWISGVAEVIPTPPAITQNPSPQTVFVGGSASLSVLATGTSPLQYQWLKGGQEVADATHSTFTLASCEVADSGLYSVVVANAYGAVTSAPARLWVTTNTFDLGMVAYYPFNGNANDESGNGNNGVANGVVLTDDRFGQTGKAYSFGGDGDHVRIEPAPNFWSAGQLTFSCWINIKPGGLYSPRILHNGTLDVGLTDTSGNPQVFFAGWGFYGLTFTNNLHSNVDYHLVGSYDGTTVRLYVNGSEVASTNVSWTFQVTSLPLGVGRNLHTGTDWYSGAIDDIRLYNRALTPKEVAELYEFEWPDADRDGLNDVEELNVYHTDPNKADTDGDGLSDYREVRVFLTDPLKADTDGDGYNDYAEIYAGKNPNDGNDHPAATLSAFTAIELEFITQTGKVYQIQSSPDLINWSNFAEPILGDGNVWSKTYSTRGQGRTFYRVELAP